MDFLSSQLGQIADIQCRMCQLAGIECLVNQLVDVQSANPPPNIPWIPCLFISLPETTSLTSYLSKTQPADMNFPANISQWKEDSHLVDKYLLVRQLADIDFLASQLTVTDS